MNTLTRSKPLTGEQVMSTVCDYFHFSPSDIRGRRRTVRIALARHIICYLCRELTDHSFADIGELIERDHGSAMWGVNRIKEHLASGDESAIRDTIIDLRRQMRHENETRQAEAEATRHKLPEQPLTYS